MPIDKNVLEFLPQTRELTPMQPMHYREKPRAETCLSLPSVVSAPGTGKRRHNEPVCLFQVAGQYTCVAPQLRHLVYEIRFNERGRCGHGAAYLPSRARAASVREAKRLRPANGIGYPWMSSVHCSNIALEQTHGLTSESRVQLCKGKRSKGCACHLIGLFR